eukprot:TRINITY_DN36147_c0_g1_i1.p1 TRINITY_DN36147_c0_g1~~TRINITY_DN36147_c0_g1_i1.p1  ORF type:complete len:292 (+),score=51.45 TRINITY_DN36147_c0_g1_i1:83-877(+)
MAAMESEKAVAESTGFLAGFRRSCFCCRRRSSADISAKYGELRRRGEALSKKEKEEYAGMAWWTDAKTKNGARVFVLAPRGPGGDLTYDVPMMDLLAYVLTVMHEAVVVNEEQYAVVWAQGSDHRLWPWQAWRFKQSLPDAYRDGLEAVYVVHPSWTVRGLRLALWPFASEEFWDYFECEERLEFLESRIDLKAVKLPQDLYEYDKILDEQADSLSKQAASQMGVTQGMFTEANDASSKQFKQQIEEMERILREKGFRDGKKDN